MFGEHTFHNEIKYLLPATLLSFSTKKIIKTKYWTQVLKIKLINLMIKWGKNMLNF